MRLKKGKITTAFYRKTIETQFQSLVVKCNHGERDRMKSQLSHRFVYHIAALLRSPKIELYLRGNGCIGYD